MKKNDFFLTLMLTIAALMTGQTAWADWTGDGSSDNPYQIDSYAKLKEFAAMVNGTGVYNESANPDACAILTGDIVCKNSFDDEDYATDWTPIGNATNKYTGTFDGRDQDGKVHTIIGLSTSTDNTSDYVGLFGYVGSSGKVQNVKLEDANITGKSYVGGIVGNSAGIVQYCALIGTSNIRSSGGYSGGIAGFNSGTVKNSYVAISGSCSISSTNSNAGGIVGYNNATIENCHYSGSGAISANEYIGGTVGYNANYGNGRVHNCYYAGTGTIGGSNANYVGAVIGYNHNNATPQYCYYNKNNTTLTKAIGNANDTENVKGLTTDQFKFISNFSGFTVENWSQGEIAPLLKGVPYTISFNANGGSGSMANQTVTLGDNDLLRVNAFTRTNYHFMGWNTKADGTGVAVATNAQACLVGPETLYAQWALASGTCGDSGNENNVTWAVTDTNGDGRYETLTISGTGAMKNPQQPWAAFKSDITTVVIGDGVTRIGGNAFYQFTALTSVTIASSVTTIGNAAFYECTNLTAVSGASGVTYVDSSAFYGTAWENNLPNGLNYVGHVAYRFVGDGTSVNLDAATTQIYEACFRYSKITSIVIPASVERIGDQAFAHSALQKMYVLRHESSFPEITQLGEYAFEGCFNLTIVVPAAAYDDYNGLWFSGQGSSILKRGYTVTSSTAGITATSYAPIVAQGEEVTLSYTGTVSEGYEVRYSIDGGNSLLVGNTFTMPARNVTVTATCKKLLTNTDIAVGAIADQPYTGSDITPEVTVWDGTTDISGECDFAYSDNEDTGTATVTITAKAASTGYSGSRTTTFNIVPKNVGDYGAVQILEDQYGTHGIIDGNYSGDVVVNLKEDIEVKDVTFNRTFPTDSYCTLVLPFEISTSKLTGVDCVLSFMGMTYDENDVLTYMAAIVWEESMDPVELQPFTPYIVLMNNPHLGINTTSPTSPVMFKRTEDAFTERGDWEFRGIYSYKVWDQNSPNLGRVYGFAATAVTEDKIEIGDFVRAEAGAYIYPLRAYLYYTGSDTNLNHSQSLRRAPAIDELPDRIPVRIVNDEDADRISLTPALSKGEGDWYIIDGRKLGGKPTQRGLYINGGKKVVVK